MRGIDRLILSPRWFQRLILPSVLLGLAAFVMLVLTVAGRGEPNLFAAELAGMFLGVAAGMASDWNRERGLWMLFGLCGVLGLMLALLFGAGIMRDVVEKPGRFAAEGPGSLLAVPLLAAAMALLLTGGVWNWRQFRRRGPGTAGPPGPPQPPPSRPGPPAPPAPPMPPPEPSPVPALPRHPHPALSAYAVAAVQEE